MRMSSKTKTEVLYLSNLHPLSLESDAGVLHGTMNVALDLIKAFPHEGTQRGRPGPPRN